MDKKTYILLAISFIIGLAAGGLGKDKIRYLENRNAALTKENREVKEQLDNCQKVIEKNGHAIEIMGNIVGLGGDAVQYTFLEDIAGLNETSAKVESYTNEINSLTEEIKPLAKKCWNE